ncbi:MAG: hypothetical protein K2P94_17995 [Rhodospirillaceae bacterium]|nr:hypothetical protein [Rhodospirillaceae bacterium]
MFDDIPIMQRLKLLNPQDDVPRQGILSGFDYRKPFENAGLENALGQTDKSFAPLVSGPPMSTNDIWRARALSAEVANKPLEPGFGAMPQVAAPSTQEMHDPKGYWNPNEAKAELQNAYSHINKSSDVIQPNPIPQSFFDPPEPTFRERINKYTHDVHDAFRRGSGNALPDIGDRLRASAQTATGLGGEFGHFDRNFEREKVKTQLAEINSPVAYNLGELTGSLAFGAFGARGKGPRSAQDLIKDGIFKSPTLPPPPPQRIPLRVPKKPRLRFNDY